MTFQMSENDVLYVLKMIPNIVFSEVGGIWVFSTNPIFPRCVNDMEVDMNGFYKMEAGIFNLLDI